MSKSSFDYYSICIQYGEHAAHRSCAHDDLEEVLNLLGCFGLGGEVSSDSNFADPLREFFKTCAHIIDRP